MIPKYDKSKIGSCEEWQGRKNESGRAVTTFDGRLTNAARATWIQAHGAIRKGLMVCHKCDNPACIRLDHLFLGTAKDNFHDALKKGRVKVDPEKWKKKARADALSTFTNSIIRMQRRRFVIETCAKQNRMKRSTIETIRETTYYARPITIIKWSIQQIRGIFP